MAFTNFEIECKKMKDLFDKMLLNKTYRCENAIQIVYGKKEIFIYVQLKKL